MSGLTGSPLLRPAELLASLTETFTSGLSTVRSPSPLPDITTVATGRFHRRVFHPLDLQLASLHRFPAFIGTMGAYDCSPTLPCHLWSPLAAGTPRRGPVRFPWDTLVSLGTWFSSGWAEPHPARERSVALLGSREVLLKACPGLGTPATPEQPRVSVARMLPSARLTASASR